MRDILKRVFIGVAIGMALFFLKTQVFAATVTLSSNQFQYSRHTCTINENNCTDFYISGYSNFGTWLTLPQQNPTGLTGPWVYFIASYYKANATLTTGNVYTVIFRTQFNPKERVINHTNSIQYNIYGLVNGSFSDNYISTQSCSTRNVVTHDYAIETTCVFQVNTNSTGFLIRSVYTNTLAPDLVTMSNAQAFSSQNEIGAIIELTNVIKQQFSFLITSIITNNDNIYGPNDDATWFPSDSYPVDAWLDEAEPLDQSMDVDVSSFLFDTNTWAGPFSYIWSLVTSFVTVNLKVFSMITAFLTLSFVGLVLGRS